MSSEPRADGAPEDMPFDGGAEPTVDAWRQWVHEWVATPGTHRLRVRATDATGYLQTEEEADVVPDGATGWHTVVVDVAA